MENLKITTSQSVVLREFEKKISTKWIPVHGGTINQGTIVHSMRKVDVFLLQTSSE